MKKINNRILIIALIVLVGTFVVTKLVRSPRRESNLDVSVFRVDTSRVTEVRIKSQIDSLKETRLVKAPDGWHVVRNNVKDDATRDRMRIFLGSVQRFRPERIVTRKEEKHDDFHVTEDKATSIKIFSEDNKVLDLFIGKEAGGATYVRPADGDEVYALDGYLQSSFNKRFDDWRNPAFLRVVRGDVQKIEFNYPDSAFVLERRDGWMIDGQPADSTKVDRYLSRVASKTHDVFVDDFSPAGDPDVSVTIHAGSTPVVVKGWKTSFYQWVFHSSLQPENYFLDENKSLVEDVLATRGTFELVK